jgi:hypothetical protein
MNINFDEVKSKILAKTSEVKSKADFAELALSGYSILASLFPEETISLIDPFGLPSIFKKMQEDIHVKFTKENFHYEIFLELKTIQVNYKNRTIHEKIVDPIFFLKFLKMSDSPKFNYLLNLGYILNNFKTLQVYNALTREYSDLSASD